MEISFFRRKLKANGFSITTDLSVKYWLEGEVRRPLNFLKLLNALACLEIIQPGEISDYNSHNFN
jgi:hypothetical protein